jgi:hypothetical protein
MSHDPAQAFEPAPSEPRPRRRRAEKQKGKHANGHGVTAASAESAGPQSKRGGPFEPFQFEKFDPANMPTRPFLLGNTVLRRAPTAISAPGGHNKSTLLTQRLIAVATGRAITGERVWQKGRVWLLNAEEDIDEIKRRIAAICIEFGIPQDELQGNLLIGARDADMIRLAKIKEGMAVATIDVERMIATALDHRIIYIGIDPLIQFHDVEENANEQMKLVIRQCGIIAERADCAVEFAAHAKKGAIAADPDSSRGASAIRDGVRKMMTLAVMDEKEAKNLSVKDDERQWFVRLDNAKGNLNPPASEATWFRRVSVSLGNGTPERPADLVGVLRPIDMTTYVADKIANDPDRQSLAQAICDAMPSDRCPASAVLAIAMDHGVPVKKRAGHDRIVGAIPLAPAFRRVTHAGRPMRLYLVRQDPDNQKSPLEVCRCADKE